MIPYGRQDIDAADIAAVVEVLGSDFLTQGPAVPRFEAALAGRVGAAHGVAVNSATSALHIACLALGLGPGDWLWTSPITFLASANCALYCGAAVDFVDIDPRTYNMCPAALERKLQLAEAEGRLPKVVVPVHYAGQSCDMREIGRLSQRYGFSVIEDASHAVGAMYRGEPVGNCRYGDIAVFSFHPVKIVTTTEGGIALTNRGDLARRMELLRSHGMTRDPALMAGESHGPWYYQQVELGFNYRMTDLQAALGLSQLRKLDRYLEKRHAIAQRYSELLADLPVGLPWQDPEARSSLHLYPVRVAAQRRRELFDALRERGIGVNVHYIPVHMQPYQRAHTRLQWHFPEAEKFYAEALTLPLYPTLTAGQQDEVAAALRQALGHDQRAKA
jgi:UDP-4-amino-4,6-dideoxy-N-acetyl-beta-L-altrosamine transaminase